MAKTKTFSVNTQKDPDTLVSEAKQVAKENDATFEGDTSSGRFSGKGGAGDYEVTGQAGEAGSQGERCYVRGGHLIGELLGQRRRRQLRDKGPDGGGHHNRQAYSGSL